MKNSTARQQRTVLEWLMGGFLALAIAGCGGDSEEPNITADSGEVHAASANSSPATLNVITLEADRGDYAALLEKGRLRVLVPYAQPYYFLDEGQPRGITFEMFREFGDFLEKREGLRSGDLTVTYVPCELGQILNWLDAGYGDIAAGGLTVTPEREQRASFSDPVAKDVNEILVSSRGADALESIEDLAGARVTVSAGSSYLEHLRAQSAALEERGLAAIEVRVAPATLSTEDLLEMLNAGILERIVCDDYKAELWAQVLANIRPETHIKVHSGGTLAWGVRRENPELLANLNEFVAVSRKGTLLGNILIKRYFKTSKWIKDPTDAEGRERIERYAGWMKELATEYGFDWLRIAAQCYQESGLDPDAESRSGALGLMQLLPSTGKDMGCDDLLDPEQNLRAGVRYLDWLRKNFFADPGLAEVDRVDFILAAYNAGPGNVRKWRKAAPARGLDPDRWRGNVEILAREGVGVQPIHYVNNIEKYFVAYSLASDLIAQRELQAR